MLLRRILLLGTRSFHTENLAVAAGQGPQRRTVPRTVAELRAVLGQEVVSPPGSRLLRLAIVGVPNSGKSTLINTLLDRKVCSVSSKVHTTEVTARAVLVEQQTQLVILDTPGLVSQREVKKHNLSKSVLLEAEASVSGADLVAVVHDVSNKHTRGSLDPKLLRVLALNPTVPCVLVLNKVDILKGKRQLLDVTRALTDGQVDGRTAHVEVHHTQPLDKQRLIAAALADTHDGQVTPDAQVDTDKDTQLNELNTIETKSNVDMVQRDGTLNSQSTEGPKTTRTINPEDVFSGKIKLTEREVRKFVEGRVGWPMFRDVFMVSALDGTGVEDLKDFFLSYAYYSPWLFSADVMTDQNPQDLAVLTVREKFLDTFKNEIPYNLKFSIEHWDLSEEDIVYITVKVGCRRRGLVKLLVGGGGRSVIALARAAQQDLRNTFGSEVRLRLNVEYDPSLK